MRILHLLLVSYITKQLSNSIIPESPFLTTIKISNMKKNLCKEGLAHGHSAEDPFVEIHNQNFDIFNKNSIFFKTSLFPDFLTVTENTLVVLQIFNDKLKLSESYFTITQNKSFIASVLTEGNTSMQTMKRCYENLSLTQSKFLCFSLMQNDKKDRPLKFNAFTRLTAIFSMILVVYVNIFQKKPLFLQKFLLTNYKLKTCEKKKQKNILIFVIFFINSFQILYDNNSTLIITNLNDFKEIDQYKNNTKFINISEGIYSIPSSAFSGWPLVISVNFGNSISDIGGSVFSLCSNLERIIFGGNVTRIGGSAFSLCSSINSITIPNSVTSIGSYAFSLCSNLMILTLGSGIREIGGSAFGNCNSLECIYYYGDTEPNIGTNAFYNVTTTVITYPTYVGSKFGNLDVGKDNTEGNCSPIATISFSSSHTLSRSDTFTESYQNELTKSFSYLLTITLSITHSFTYYEIQTKSLSLFTINSSNVYIETEFIYYDYTVIIYSTYYIYYSNFFTFIYINEFQTNDNKTTIIIIIVCVIVVAIIIISLLIILLNRIKNKKEEIDENENEDSEQQNDNNQTTNTFTTGISISNIEEDPFADDFKEDKFIEQM